MKSLRRDDARDRAGNLIKIERFADDAGDQINFAEGGCAVAP